MPQEIIPVHKLEMHEGLFEPKFSDNITGLSDLQMQFMGIQKSAAKMSFSEQTLKLLDEITKHEDDVLTATEVVAYQGKESRKAEIVFKVPTKITDNDLLALKTQGLIQGRDRAVKLTDLGRVALRDFWLKSGNSFLETRAKQGFELERLASISLVPDEIKPTTNRKFARIIKKD